MPKTITVGQTANAVLTGVGSDGKPWNFSASDTIAISAATPADVTFGAPTFNADGSATIVVTGVNPDPGDVLTVVADGVTSNTDTLTINAAAPTLQSVTLTLQ